MQKRHLLRASAAAAFALSTGLTVLPAVAQDYAAGEGEA